MKIVKTDGLMIRETHFEGNQAHGLLTMDPAVRTAILERNLRLRNEPEALRKLQSMGLELSIPEEDYYNLRQKYPDLASPDSLTRSLAWKAFMATAEAIPYRVRPL